MARNLSALQLFCTSVSETGRQKMINQDSDIYNSNIIDPMNKAFDNGNFYGLEYVLDELVRIKPRPDNQITVDWFGAADYFA
jgi:hypothetical protein